MTKNVRRTSCIVIALMCVSALLMTMLMGASCNDNKEQQRTDLILATTTSVQDSGLLDQWIPMFEAANPYTVKVIAVGSGAAIEMGRKGEADVLLVHSPKDEQKLVDDGYGVNRTLIMHNDFIIVGPDSDPAGIKGMTSASDAFARIAETGSTFVSRGDGSGTNKKEISLWQSAIGADKPSGDWYIETGKGMADTLRVANEKNAYTLSDRATFTSLKDQLQLVLLMEGDKALLNTYSVIEVNPEMYSNVNVQGAKDFAAFVLSPEAQELLNTFGIEKYGQQLFYPDALPPR
jgi:tungstate transport system substrate-binding protein